MSLYALILEIVQGVVSGRTASVVDFGEELSERRRAFCAFHIIDKDILPEHLSNECLCSFPVHGRISRAGNMGTCTAWAHLRVSVSRRRGVARLVSSPGCRAIK